MTNHNTSAWSVRLRSGRTFLAMNSVKRSSAATTPPKDWMSADTGRVLGKYTLPERVRSSG